jgi:hypothetical protein
MKKFYVHPPFFPPSFRILYIEAVIFRPRNFYQEVCSMMKHTKKIILAALIAFVCAGAVSARDHRRDGRRRVPPVGTAVTVTGTLQLINGEIAVVQSGNTYYANRLHRFVGFIDGIKEGATVTLKGTAYQLPLVTGFYKLAIAEMTINGKTYTGLDRPGPADRA